jgi:hypothetical protein
MWMAGDDGRAAMTPTIPSPSASVELPTAMKDPCKAVMNWLGKLSL